VFEAKTKSICCTSQCGFDEIGCGMAAISPRPSCCRKNITTLRTTTNTCRLIPFEALLLHLTRIQWTASSNLLTFTPQAFFQAAGLFHHSLQFPTVQDSRREQIGDVNCNLADWIVELGLCATCPYACGAPALFGRVVGIRLTHYTGTQSRP